MASGDFPDDDSFNQFKEMIKRMFGSQFGSFMKLFNNPDLLKKLQEDGHFDLGFSLSTDENGNVNIRPFSPGMIFPDELNPSQSSSDEPFFDVLEDKDQIIVIGDVVGYNKENIQIGSKDHKLIIKGKTDSKSFNKEVELSDFDPKSVKVKLRNGTLEITVKVFAKESDHKIKIE